MKPQNLATIRHRILLVFFHFVGIYVLATAAAVAADYLGPDALASSKDGKNLYVACRDASKLVVVDIAGRKVVQTIALPAEPTGLVSSPDGLRLYVTCAAPKSAVCVVDPSTGEIIDSLPAGHTATGAAITPNGNRLYVCNRFDNNVTVIDLTTGKTIASVPATREPCAAVATPDGKSVFVANILPLDRADSADVAAAITAIDTSTNEPTTIRLLNGSSSVRGLCVSPDGKYVYVVHILSHYQLPTTQLDRGWMNTNAMSILDATAKKLVNIVLLDDLELGAANPWGVAVGADGKWICATHAGVHELSVIDAAGLWEKLAKFADSEKAIVSSDLAFLVDLRRRIRLEGNGPRGVVVIGGMAYIAEHFSDTIGVVDLESAAASPLGRIALGPSPQIDIRRRGEMLFNDAGLCFQHWQSCASCHPDSRVDGLNWDLLNDGLGNPKNTRSMVAAHGSGPVMSLPVRESARDAVRAGMRGILFLTRPEEEAQAIDDYLASLEPVPSPRLIDGNLSPAAERGKEIFFNPAVGCAACHPAPLYTDMRVHDVGSSGALDKPTDKFNTSRLIETWRTSPYMHDGRYITIKELFVNGKHDSKSGSRIKLTERQIDDLVEFVLSL
jgi:YVTN family beta-propeller protein